jgi:lysylphosphatidylglycerol synthetase-like protein (DUF2156 family)
MALFDLSLRRAYLQRFGSQPNAYLNLQPDLSYFDVPGLGFVSYFSQPWVFGAIPIVVTRPVCAPEASGELLAHFIDQVGDAVFAGADGETASALSTLGYSVTQFGVSFDIVIRDFHTRGRRMQTLRSASKLGQRGVSVRELRGDAVNATEVAEVSRAWRATKQVAHREVRLFTRPPAEGDPWKVRRFYAFIDERVVAYVAFDPFYRDGRVLGYTANILRSLPNLKPAGVLDFIILRAMAQFESEGVEMLSLGQAPLHDITPNPKENVWCRLFGQFAYRYGGSTYNFRQLAFHKTRYRVPGNKVYTCLRNISAATAGLAAVRAARIL